MVGTTGIAHKVQQAQLSKAMLEKHCLFSRHYISLHRPQTSAFLAKQQLQLQLCCKMQSCCYVCVKVRWEY